MFVEARVDVKGPGGGGGEGNQVLDGHWDAERVEQQVVSGGGG